MSYWLLLHCDGANNSTTFVDSSVNNFTVLASGDAKLTTDQRKFGTTAIVFDGTADVVKTNLPDIGTGDFTLEAWVYTLTSDTVTNYRAVMFIRQATSNIGIYQYGTTLCFWAGSARRCTTGTISYNAWHHVAVTRSGQTIRMFLDGVKSDSDYDSAVDISNASGVTGYKSLCIGGNSSSLETWYGYIDEVAVTVGTAKYTSNFTPPTRPFSDRYRNSLFLAA